MFSLNMLLQVKFMLKSCRTFWAVFSFGIFSMSSFVYPKIKCEIVALHSQDSIQSYILVLRAMILPKETHTTEHTGKWTIAFRLQKNAIKRVKGKGYKIHDLSASFTKIQFYLQNGYAYEFLDFASISFFSNNMHIRMAFHRSEPSEKMLQTKVISNFPCA